jgi:hypothetical protein
MSISTNERAPRVPESDPYSAAPRSPLVLDAAALEHVVASATSAWVNAHAPHLAPLDWRRHSMAGGPLLLGRILEDEVDDPQALAQQWAAELNLAEEEDPMPGTRNWRGDVLFIADGRIRYPVEVWYIVDREVFESRT